MPVISDEELAELVKYDHSVDVFTNEFYTVKSSIGILFFSAHRRTIVTMARWSRYRPTGIRWFYMGE